MLKQFYVYLNFIIINLTNILWKYLYSGTVLKIWREWKL